MPKVVLKISGLTKRFSTPVEGLSPWSWLLLGPWGRLAYKQLRVALGLQAAYQTAVDDLDLEVYEATCSGSSDRMGRGRPPPCG